MQDAFGALGFAAKKTAKGGVLIDLGGAESEEGALLLTTWRLADMSGEELARRMGEQSDVLMIVPQ